MVMEVVEEDIDIGMSCTDHPYKNHTPGGICAFCLQDKLGKLVSSSFQTSIFPASATSSLSSPSDPTVLVSKQTFPAKKENKGVNSVNIIFQRSKSTAVQRPRGFWSFLALNRVRAFPTGGVGSFRQRSVRDGGGACGDGGGDGGDGRRVSRSRSVGCGSRSFSGDFFERISTGFGDCTLRRVESTREGKPKNTPTRAAAGDRVKCGGIFGGFSSSSSSSSSTNWSHAPPCGVARRDARGGGEWRSKGWGWALASPIRAFSKPRRESSKRNNNNANVTPNLSAIPSILAV